MSLRMADRKNSLIQPEIFIISHWALSCLSHHPPLKSKPPMDMNIVFPTNAGKKESVPAKDQPVEASKTKQMTLIGGNTDQNRPPWPGTTVTICMSYFITGGPGKEHRTNKPLPRERIQKRSKGQSICPTNLPERILLKSISAKP